jgi:hypothetical protein
LSKASPVTLHRKNKEVYPIAYIFSEKVTGVVEQEGAFASLVSYKKDGFSYEAWLENDDFVVLHEVAFVYLDDDEEYRKFIEKEEDR